MDRYTRQIQFLGEKEQQTLSKKSVAIVGLGALGSVAAELLTRAGIGHLTLIDHDIVDITNLQRQSLYNEDDVNSLKAQAAWRKLEKMNDEVTLTASPTHLTADNAQLLKSDVVLDCTDNLEARFIINDYCRKQYIPWVHAAAAGSVGVILPIAHDYCFNCVYGHVKNALTCDDSGILNTVSFTTASIQVTQALKMLIGKEHTRGLIRFNLWKNSFETLKVKKNENCAVCTKKREVPATREFTFTVQRCKTRAAYSTRPNRNIKLDLKKIKENFKTIVDTPIVVVVKQDDVEIIIHNYGELVFRKFDDVKRIKQLAGQIYEVGK